MSFGYRNPLGIIMSKTLDDGSLMIAMEYGSSSVALFHYYVREFEITYNPPSSLQHDYLRYWGKREFEPRLELALANFAIITRQEFDAGGYEDKMRKKPSEIDRTLYLTGPEV
jgi:hypothetical protein